MRTDDVCAALVRVLSVYLGDTMARSSIEAQCQKLGIDSEMTPDELEALLAKLGSGLNVFVGRHRSAHILDEMKRAVGGGGPPR
jgi:hypothetical protein